MGFGRWWDRYQGSRKGKMRSMLKWEQEVCREWAWQSVGCCHLSPTGTEVQKGCLGMSPTPLRGPSPFAQPTAALQTPLPKHTPAYAPAEGESANPSSPKWANGTVPAEL